MRKFELRKRIIALLLVFTNMIPCFCDVVNAQNSVSEASDNIYMGHVNFYDYRSSVMNQITMNKVADKLSSDIDTGIVCGDEIKGDVKKLVDLYPSLLFVNAGSISKNSASCDFMNELGENDTINFSTKDFYKDKYHDHNINNCGSYSGTVYHGIVKDELDGEVVDNKVTYANATPKINMISADLFDPQSPENNKNSYLDVEMPFVINDDGYCVIDNKEYNYQINSNKTKVNVGPYENPSDKKNFVPLGVGNYHFSMSFFTEFVIPEDRKYNGKDLVFEFEGDDDVWVFVDGKLVLDLGGIHAVTNGSINFTKKQVEYGKKVYNRTINGPVSFELSDDTIHQLNVFYFERGAAKSNCKIMFNLPTLNEQVRGDYSFKKIDSRTNEPIEGVEFSLYTDSACSDKIYTANSDSDGIVKFDDLLTGEYYIKETSQAPGYNVNNKVYKLLISGNSQDNLVYTFEESNNGVDFTPVQDKAGDYDVVYNEPLDKMLSLDKTAKLNNWQDRTYEITLKADTYLQANAENNLATSANASDNQGLKGKVVDVLDYRFELTDNGKSFLLNDGAEIYNNQDGTTKIVWKNQNLINWERKFEIKAKDEYIGGNNVMTNVPNDSRVVAEDDDRTITEAFPKPVVNVRIELKAGEARDQIFLGQSLEKYFDDGTDNDFKNLFDIRSDVKYLEDVNNLIYSWDVEGKDRQYGSPNEFIDYVRSLTPTVSSDTVPFKKLYVSLTPRCADDSDDAKKAAIMMKKNDRVPEYTACMSDKNDTEIDEVTVTGKYYVTIVDGEITVDKTYNHSFLTGLIYSKEDIDAIEAVQTAVFTVYKYAEDASVEEIANGTATILDKYDITITGEGSQTITGIEAGMYRVVENTNWTWKYDADLSEENDNSTDGIFYIGKESPNAEIVDSQTVSFENKIDDELKKIYSDTTNVLNVFVGN